MTKPDMEFDAVYNAETDTNLCTGTLRVGTNERVKSEALEGEAAEATKQRMRERLARELIEWIQEYTPTLMEGLMGGWSLKDGVWEWNHERA